MPTAPVQMHCGAVYAVWLMTIQQWLTVHVLALLCIDHIVDNNINKTEQPSLPLEAVLSKKNNEAHPEVKAGKLTVDQVCLH
jgi:hypothetical protein